MSAANLWSAVVARYDEPALVTLTNRTDRSATTVNTTIGEAAARAVIDLWPIYAQEDYDESVAAHVEVGVAATIAQLWRWGGTATESARVKWDEVFGSGGMMERVQRTGPRGRRGPSSNSDVSTSSRAENGRLARPWADPASLPDGILPTDRTV
jgi:hypothetical protein